MNLVKIVKNNLQNFYYDNIIYSFDESEKKYLEEIKEYLKEDYGYLDIVLDFNDYNKLDKLISNIPKKLDVDIIKSTIIRQYLLCSILKNGNISNIKGNSVDKLQDDLYKGDYNNYLDTFLLLFEDDYELLREKAKDETKNKYARIHFLLDNVNDICLQKNINNLFVYRGDIAMMGYTSKDLSSYLTTSDVLMESPHDYSSYVSDKSLVRAKRKKK